MIDALNSICYCIKYRSNMKDLLSRGLHEGLSPERIVGDEDMREGSLMNIGKKSEGNVFE